MADGIGGRQSYGQDRPLHQNRHDQLGSAEHNLSNGLRAPHPLDLMTRNEAIKQYGPFIRMVVMGMIRRLPPQLDLNDLLQAGMIGMNDALTKYDPSLGNAFEAYARTKIRGAVLDEMRTCDPLGRQDRKLQRDLEQAEDRLTSVLGRRPAKSEIAVRAGVSLESLCDVEMRLVSARPHSLSAPYFEDHGGHEERASENLCGPAPEEDSPDWRIDDRRKKDLLRKSIFELEEREQQILSMRVEHDLSLKEIGAVLHLTESRVSQILTSITQQLARKMAKRFH